MTKFDKTMDLMVLKTKLPLRAYQKEDLNKILLMDFMPWLASLLSLTDEVSADRLETAMPAIKEQCIGMGFNEIKKMFEMYADNKLSIKPIPNYFDRILLGKIVAEFKALNLKPKQMEESIISDDEKEFIMIEAVDRIEKEYKSNKEITGAFTHVYGYLFDKGVLPQHTNKFKSGILVKAKAIAKSEAMSKAGSDFSYHQQLKDTLENIDNNKHDSIATISKRLVLEEYFKNN